MASDLHSVLRYLDEQIELYKRKIKETQTMLNSAKNEVCYLEGNKAQDQSILTMLLNQKLSTEKDLPCVHKDAEEKP